MVASGTFDLQGSFDAGGDGEVEEADKKEDSKAIKAPHKYNSTMVYKLFTMEPFCWHIEQIACLTDYQIDKYYLKPGKELSDEYERKTKGSIGGGGSKGESVSEGGFPQITLKKYLNFKKMYLGDQFDEQYWTEQYYKEIKSE